jgi:protein SCO1
MKSNAKAGRPLTRPSATLSPSDGERDGVRGFSPDRFRTAARGLCACSFGVLAAALLTASSLLAAEPISSPKEKELPPCCRKVEASAPLTDKSLYQLDSTWTSDVGTKTKLEVLKGRPQVLAMFFSHCEYACPILVHDMKRIEAALPKSMKGQVDFVLVSFDTERDTPEALKTYREKEHLPLKNWSLFTGAPDDVRELAALLGVNYQKDAKGQFAHSNLITVLNAEGEIAYQLKGLNQRVEDVVAVLEKEAKKPMVRYGSPMAETPSFAMIAPQRRIAAPRQIFDRVRETPIQQKGISRNSIDRKQAA